MLDALRGERIKYFVSPSPHFLHKPSLPFESVDLGWKVRRNRNEEIGK